jgi:predicted lysophospholipase L1 biosynthesis ABC-type transport system permease subunit
MSLADSEFDPGDATPDVELTVVGTALAPMFGESDLGDTSLVTLDAIRAGGGDPTPRLQMIRFAGSDRSRAAAEIDQKFTEDLVTDIIPARVVNMHRVRSVPMLGILLAGVLGTITLAYVIVAGARIHRRELAILRALGLEAKQLRRVLAWQGVLTALAMLIIGLPLALVAGNVLWRRVADDTGVASVVFVPPQLLLLIPATLVVAIAASVVANSRVRRTRVADLLREE